MKRRSSTLAAIVIAAVTALLCGTLPATGSTGPRAAGPDAIPAAAHVAAAAGGLSGIPSNSRQVISVSAAPGATTGTLTAWQRSAAGVWSKFLGPIGARLGSRGIGPAREGSSYTPAGTMRLDQAFGRLADPGTRLPYFTTDSRDWWDGNVSSPTYNLHVRRSSSPGGASENLYYAGTAYNYAVNMAWNPARTPGAGSAFFLHVSTGSPTAGCVAINQGSLATLMRWLDPAKNPVITIRTGSAWKPSLKIPSRLTQTTPSRTIVKPDSTSLKGTLTSVTGQRLSGMVVKIWARAHGGKNWANLGSATTRSDGSYRYTFRPNGHKDYQVRWTGSSTWHGSTSVVKLIRTR